MAVILSGPISIDDIDTEFGLGKSIGSYRGGGSMINPYPNIIQMDRNETNVANTTNWSTYWIKPGYWYNTYNIDPATDEWIYEYVPDQEMSIPNRTYNMTSVSGLGSVLMHYNDPTADGITSLPVYKKLTMNLPSHDEVRYQVYWHFVDTHDYEYNYIHIDGAQWAQFRKYYNYTYATIDSTIFPVYNWNVPTYSYTTRSGGAPYNGYISFDTGWFTHTASSINILHNIGANQTQADEASYLSHVRLRTRFSPIGQLIPSTGISFSSFYGSIKGLVIDYVFVGGGGGSPGYSYYPGGGAGGGEIESGTTTIATDQIYTIEVGGGGNASGAGGWTSMKRGIITMIFAGGGAYGGYGNAGPGYIGGGGGTYGLTVGNGSYGSVAPNFKGGNGYYALDYDDGDGGVSYYFAAGGGASSLGNGSDGLVSGGTDVYQDGYATGGIGAAGLITNISGTNECLGSGGGGGASFALYEATAGVTAGKPFYYSTYPTGGFGGKPGVSPTSGAAYTGQGAGGTCYYNVHMSGGSGVAKIRYKGAQKFTGGTVSTITVGSDSYTLHTITGLTQLTPI